jgi:hypothetical protein
LIFSWAKNKATPSYMPCSYCANVIEGSTVPHKRVECPYRRGMYCYICCLYGHRVEDCPNHRARAIRKGLSPTGITNLTMRVIDSEKNIRAFLSAYDIQPSTRQSENKQLLLDLANSLQPPKMLVLVPPKPKA